ncbi:hypothetical protein ACFQZ2_01545 [Streptomonospora algeriensis]|uniref:Uncharacterized protein n=1 Tax=Streptomonospora algeriensis TaxID=995084 RepID=A0ABW3B9E3_9ACTN
MESSLANCENITNLLQEGQTVGVIAKFNRSTYSCLVNYGGAANRLLENLARVPHIVFIHEDILTGAKTEYQDEIVTGIDAEGNIHTEKASYQLPQETTETVNKLLSDHGIKITTYNRNAELSVLADAFISDHENNLMFRLYIPNGKLYAEEMSRLLDLFQDWLARVKKEHIRKDGYKTSSGQVFEFFSEESTDPERFVGTLQEFNRFLDICESPEEAIRTLQGIGVNKSEAAEIVRRYGKEVRRLRIDLKHDREQRILSIRHQLESELADSVSSFQVDLSQLDALVDRMVPSPEEEVSSLLALDSHDPLRSSNGIQIHQQFIECVYGEVSQNVAGTQSFGPDAQALIRAIQEHGGSETPDLISSVHEVSDTEARTSDRLTARQKLKEFLIRYRNYIETTAFGLAQSYVENQVGV